MTPFAIVPAAALQVLRPGLLATFVAVTSFVSAPTDTPHLTHAQIAERRGRSPHTTRKQLYELQDLGVLDAVSVVRDGAVVCVRYTIHYQRLLEMAGMKKTAPTPGLPPEVDAPSHVGASPPRGISSTPGVPTDLLYARVRTLAKAWWDVAGHELHLADEMVHPQHAIPIEERHPSGELKQRTLVTAAEYVAFALKRDPAYSDLRKRDIARAIRHVAIAELHINRDPSFVDEAHSRDGRSSLATSDVATPPRRPT